MTTQTVIGIDVSTNAKKLGLACLRLRQGSVESLEVTNGRDHDPVSMICEWASGAEHLLLAVDAPLGWPAALGNALVEHWAGSPLTAPPNEMFQRRTDQFVHQTLGKRPLDVGADRIARTAHAALRLLQQVRIELGRPLPLAWDATTEGAIEVYPAATLISRGWSTKDYKKTGELGLSARTSIVEKLQTELLIELPQPCRESDDELDAVICTLAGRDFLRGRCHEPHDLPLAQKEGWIWVRKAEQP